MDVKRVANDGTTDGQGVTIWKHALLRNVEAGKVKMSIHGRELSDGLGWIELAGWSVLSTLLPSPKTSNGRYGKGGSPRLESEEDRPNRQTE